MLSLQNISVKADNKYILRDVSIECAEGEIYCILGPSGSGKTTLLNSISGIVQLEKGKIFFNEKQIDNRPINTRNISYLQQKYPLYNSINVYDNLKIGIKNDKINNAKQLIAENLNIVMLDHNILTRKIYNLSGGEAQRVALVKEIIKYNKIMLLDEPFSNVDEATKIKLISAIISMVKNNNIICLVVTHSKQDSIMLADKLAYLKEGKIFQKGSIDTLSYEPNNIDIASIANNEIIQKIELKTIDNINSLYSKTSKSIKSIAWIIGDEEIMVSAYDINKYSIYIKDCIVNKITILKTINLIRVSIKNDLFWLKSNKNIKLKIGDCIDVSIPVQKLYLLDDNNNIVKIKDKGLEL